MIYHSFNSILQPTENIMDPLPNMRLTTQRQIILEELAKVTSHPTANEVYDMVRKRLPRIGLGTVYRNLELMADSGVILKIEVGGTQKRFDATVFAPTASSRKRNRRSTDGKPPACMQGSSGVKKHEKRGLCLSGTIPFVVQRGNSLLRKRIPGRSAFSPP